MISKLFNIHSIIGIGVIMFLLSLLGTCWYLKSENEKLNVKVSDQAINLKAKGMQPIIFADKTGKLHSQTIQQNATVAALKYSKDSADRAFVKMVNDYELKLKDVTQRSEVKTTGSYTSTKIKYVPTTKDTTYDLSHRPFIINEINFKDDSLSSHLEIFNTQNLLWHTKRETIDPPKKFFLFRWFQKKHDVTYVDVVNDNPYIKTTDQNFQIITK